jgi:hypothetical protein
MLRSVIHLDLQHRIFRFRIPSPFFCGVKRGKHYLYPPRLLPGQPFFHYEVGTSDIPGLGLFRNCQRFFHGSSWCYQSPAMSAAASPRNCMRGIYIQQKSPHRRRNTPALSPWPLVSAGTPFRGGPTCLTSPTIKPPGCRTDQTNGLRRTLFRRSGNASSKKKQAVISRRGGEALVCRRIKTAALDCILRQASSPHRHLCMRTVRPFFGLSLVKISLGFPSHWLQGRF